MVMFNDDLDIMPEFAEAEELKKAIREYFRNLDVYGPMMYDDNLQGKITFSHVKKYREKVEKLL